MLGNMDSSYVSHVKMLPFLDLIFCLSLLLWSHVKMLPFLDLHLCLSRSCDTKYPDIQVPISRTRPLDSDF